MAERGSAGQTRASVPTQADAGRRPRPHRLAGEGAHSTQSDSLLQPLVHPAIHGLVPQTAVLRLQHPVPFIREIQHC